MDNEQLDRTVHDLTNLLGVIVNYATLLGRQLTDPMALEDLSNIRTAAEQGLGLVRQLS
jgi:signal transduction histidine kinase